MIKLLAVLQRREFSLIPLKTIQKLYESILRSLEAVLNTKVVKQVVKEMLSIPQVFTLFY